LLAPVMIATLPSRVPIVRLSSFAQECDASVGRDAIAARRPASRRPTIG